MATAFNALVRIAGCLLCIAASSHGALAAERLTLYFYDRPAMHYRDEKGEVGGIIAVRAAEVLHRAGVDFVWQDLPPKRVLATLYTSDQPACSPGWFYAAERAAQATYSAPMMTDPPLVAIVGENFMPHVRDSLTATLNERPNLVLKDGFSNGAYIDKLTDAYPPQLIKRIPGGMKQMLTIVEVQRADLTFATEIEATHFLKELGDAGAHLRIVHFPDIPAGEQRYLLCSRNVSPQLLDRINAAMSKPKTGK